MPVEGFKKKKKRRPVYKHKKLVMNVAQTKYHVVKYVGKKVYQFKLSSHLSDGSTTDEKHDFDLYWCDNGVTVDRLYKMKAYQRINHFPGMFALARKDHLARNLKSMFLRFPEEYKFFPQTWLLPAEYGDFRK